MLQNVLEQVLVVIIEVIAEVELLDELDAVCLDVHLYDDEVDDDEIKTE